MIIRLTKEQKGLLIEETRKKYPIEACGVLFGDRSSKETVVRKIMVAHNILKSSTNFQIDPEDFLKALYEAEKEGMQLIGFFHSHPAPPHASMTDVRYMRLWPENIWLIISSLDNSVSAYQIVENKARRPQIGIDNRS